MILKAKHNFIIYNFFKAYTLYKLKKNFYKLEIVGDFDNRNLPLLVISNHISWWDGFWIEYLNLKIFKKKLHFMMLENQLKKHWYFNYCGGFSIKPNSKSVIESINYTCDLLKSSDNLVLMFPQGEIFSIYQNKINFRKGIDRILKNIKNPIQIIFVANLIDYFANQKPTLFIYFKEIQLNLIDNFSVEKYYQEFYNDCLDKQQKYII